MADPYIGEIRLFAGMYAPVGWMFCDGQTLAISQNEALYSLVGTTYGGDGLNVFKLPDLRGRVPVHQGNLVGNTFSPGQAGGVESVALTQAQLPAHTHGCLASSGPANSPNPANQLLAETSTTSPYFNGPGMLSLAPSSVTSAGGSRPHSNMQPYLCLNFIIATEGIYPTR